MPIKYQIKTAIRLGCIPRLTVWLVVAAVSFPLSTAFAGSIQITPTTVDSSVRGCVSDGSAVSFVCSSSSTNLLDFDDDTIQLFSIEPDVTGFSVLVDPTTISSDVGSANVFLNSELVGVLSTASPNVSAAFGEITSSQVIEIINTDAAALVYIFNATAVPIPAGVWLFGSGLLGLIGIARRKRTA